MDIKSLEWELYNVRDREANDSRNIQELLRKVQIQSDVIVKLVKLIEILTTIKQCERDSDTIELSRQMVDFRIFMENGEWKELIEKVNALKDLDWQNCSGCFTNG